MELLDELVEEILLRVPPDEPAHLVRAALVCKLWCRILSDRTFLRRYHTFHRTPPLLAYLHNLYSKLPATGSIPRFVCTSTVSPFSQAPLACDYWWAIDCRHGRVLLHTFKPNRLVVWDPATGNQHDMSVPPCPRGHCYNGAVLCAVDDDGCDHLDCHGGSFIVVFLVADIEHVMRASVYSSKTRAWGVTTSIQVDHFFEDRTSLLVGDALYFTLEGGQSILKYDLSGHRLSVIDMPGDYFAGMVMMKAEDGGLGFVAVLDNCVYLWTQQQAGANGTRWVKHRAMELETVLPKCYRRSYSGEAIGFAEGTNTIFINRRNVGLFALDLKSRKVRMVGAREAYHVILPYVSFYTPDIAKGRLSTT